MELPRRDRGDELLRPGELSALRSRLRQLSVSNDLTSVIACAFDHRTRMLPFVYASRRMAPAGVRAIGSAMVDAGFAKTRIVLQQWNPNFDPAVMKLDGRVPDLFMVSSMQIHSARCHDLIRAAGRIDPARRPLIIVGGPKTIYEPWDVFNGNPAERWGADVAVTGEEYVLLSLLERLLPLRAAGESMRAAFLRARAARFVSRDGPLWQTLSSLLFAPGAMTADYLRGRRARYVRPLKLYLITSVLVFGAAQWFGLNLGLQFYGTHGIPIHHSTRLSAEQADAPLTRFTPVRLIVDHVDTPAVRRFAAMSLDDRFKFLRARRAPYASSFVLFLVPLFALALDLFYRERRYAEHLVFGLHCQTFLLLVLLAQAKLPSVLANVLSYWTLAYLAIALKRVYGGTWAGTLVRGSLILGLYFVLFVAANLALVLVLLSV